MKPLAISLTGAVLGLAAVLPLARGQLDATSTPSTVVALPAPPPPLVLTPGAAARATPSIRVPQVVTATGPQIATRYGPVQVKVILTGGRLTSATAVQLPSADGQSREINSWAGPRLSAEAVASQGARVDTVSGATWTSGGYQRSLQAALDAARAAAGRAR